MPSDHPSTQAWDLEAIAHSLFRKHDADQECVHGRLPSDRVQACDCWTVNDVTTAEAIHNRLEAMENRHQERHTELLEAAERHHKQHLAAVRDLTEAMHAMGRNILAVNANVTARNGQ